MGRCACAVQGFRHRRDSMNDDRVRCKACRNFQRGQCADPTRAGLTVDRYKRCEIGPELAELLQRCPAHRPKVPANV